jgi:hypothetical protein
MKVTARQAHAWVTAAALVAYFVLGLVQGEIAGFSFPFDLGVWAISFGVAGWIITGADPSQGVGRVLSWAGTLAAIYGMSGQATGVWEDEMVALSDRAPAIGVLYLLVIGQLYVAVMWLVLTAIAVFPDGRYPSRVVRWAHRILTVCFIVQALIWASKPSEDGAPSLGWSFFGENEPLETISGALLALSALVIVVMSLVAMLRGGPVRRRQLGWAGLGVVVLVTMSGVTGVLPEALAGVVGMLAFVAFPAGLVVAVTKYRLYEIDRIFSRTITYVVVVGVLVAVYFGLVLVLRSFVPAESPLAVALSTLAVAFAFFPLARRVQSFVDRRFFRSRYDAAEIVASFAADLRGTIDESAVVGRAETVLDEVFAPEAVGVWVARS